MGLASRLPWWAKIGAKIVLARLPVSYDTWRRLGLFRHGEMNVPERAIRTFDAYWRRAQTALGARAPQVLAPGFRSLELGPGDSVLSGLVARAYGAGEAWLLDAGAFATTDLAGWTRTAELLRAEGRTPPSAEGARTLDEAMARSGVRYLTRGTDSLADIPAGQIDLIWSQVVLEHVPRAEFERFSRELRRVLAPGGISVHSIDFRDHLGGGLDNLRFSPERWESPTFQSSGFYTNRLRPREMLEIFEAAGFEAEVTGETRWPAMPIARRHLAAHLRALPDEDFMVAEIEVTLRARAGAAA